MSESCGSGLDRLDLNLARYLDALCRCFKANWRGGGRPRIEDDLAKFPADPFVP